MKITTVLVALATSSLAFGQGGEPPKRGGRPELTEEQKAERKAEMEKRQAEFEALSPEEKEKRKAEMEAKRAAWAKLSPEERKAKMEEGRAKMAALVKEHDKDGEKGLSKEERKALTEDPKYKVLLAEMPPRGGRQGGPGRGDRPNRGDRPGGKGNGEKPKGE